MPPEKQAKSDNRNVPIIIKYKASCNYFDCRIRVHEVPTCLRSIDPPFTGPSGNANCLLSNSHSIGGSSVVRWLWTKLRSEPRTDGSMDGWGRLAMRATQGFYSNASWTAVVATFAGIGVFESTTGQAIIRAEQGDDRKPRSAANDSRLKQK